MTTIQLQKKLEALEIKRKRANSTLSKIQQELHDLAKIACPFKPGQTIIDDAGKIFIIDSVEPYRSFCSASCKMPGYSMRGRGMKRDGNPRLEREYIKANDSFRVLAPDEMPKRPRPASKIAIALEAALALLPKSKAAKLRADHGIKNAAK